MGTTDTIGAGRDSRDPLIGRTFGQYRVLSLIQRGGMGNIYLAELAPQGIRVVIKRLQDTHTADERYVEMFQNEAALMSQLEHPNIVKVIGTPLIEGKLCLVMEFVRGRNLQQVVRRLRELGRRLPATMAVHIMRKVLLGLHEAHQVRSPDGRSLELVHRDVKPGNVLLSYAGDVKITDFGIAKSAMQNRMTTAGVVKGTVRYLSPEQIRSETTYRSDLFSCASVLVEILTDKPLFDRGPVAPTLMAILSGDRPPIEQLLPFRAPELAQVLEKALALKPEDRFETAAKFAQALGAAARSLGPPISDDALGGLLRQIFQGAGAVAGPEDLREDVTYLVQTEPPVSDRVERPSPLPRGAAPLDAAAFAEPPPLPHDPDVPPEAVAADQRAAHLLDSGIVFDAPVEVEGASSDLVEDEEPLDLDDLDIEEDVDDEAPLAAGLAQGVGGAPEPRTDPLRGPPRVLSEAVPAKAMAVVPASAPQGPPVALGGLAAPARAVDGWVQITPEMSGQWIPAGSSADWPAVDRPPSSSSRSTRVYVLAGCLAGVMLTVAVVMAVGL